MKTVRQRYEEYFAKLEAGGATIITYACPQCTESIKTLVAPAGQRWDTTCICPHCGGMHTKITQGGTITTEAL